MPFVRVPALFRYYLNQQTQVSLPGASVQETLQALIAAYPAIGPHLFDSQGRLRRHINLFVNSENIRSLNELETALSAEDVLKILPSVTGG